MAGRYRIEASGDERFVVSISATNVRLCIVPGLSVTKSTLGQVQDQTIFLDGAFCGPPFHDIERQIYSLDHHEGCVRTMTLATCEQAAVALVTGLPLADGRWTLVINEPDLDAILAAWVLLNHVDLLRDDAALLEPVMPLLRTEGNIDSYGYGKEVLAALPKAVYQAEHAKLDALMQPIRELKSAGRWHPSEYEGVVLRILDALDQLLLPPALLGQLMEFQELGRVRLRGRKTAILCRSAHGIYEVEEHLRVRYGDMLGLVVLDQGAGKYTIRRSDGFAVPSLRRLYKALNRADANAAAGRNGENRWGGADDIGGSPRETGSALAGPAVLQEIDRVFGEPLRLWKRIVRFLTRRRSIPRLRSVSR